MWSISLPVINLCRFWELFQRVVVQPKDWSLVLGQDNGLAFDVCHSLWRGDDARRVGTPRWGGGGRSGEEGDVLRHQRQRSERKSR